MDLKTQIAQLKDLAEDVNLESHHQGWRANDLLDSIKNNLSEIWYIISCPRDKTICADCHEHVAKGVTVCPTCGCDFTR